MIGMWRGRRIGAQYLFSGLDAAMPGRLMSMRIMVRAGMHSLTRCRFCLRASLAVQVRCAARDHWLYSSGWPVCLPQQQGSAAVVPFAAARWRARRARLLVPSAAGARSGSARTQNTLPLPPRCPRRSWPPISPTRALGHHLCRCPAFFGVAFPCRSSVERLNSRIGGAPAARGSVRAVSRTLMRSSPLGHESSTLTWP